ncbi:bifunctional DNA primase/polymerase [Actinomycetaceae bacterium MB13-C1-2]|nr:bifunctional DNA primase/polymerase [Actinomycetaceae bacterium MB13-C1-2]
MNPLALVFKDLRTSPALAARQLAEAGVPVFPCIPGGKRPLPGSNGFLDATTNPEQINSWWRRTPNANLAIPTGSESGVVVVDVDVHGTNGFHAFSQARAAGLLPKPLVVVRTPSGGMHRYYPAKRDSEQRSWQVAKAGIDFRGDGGYVLIPPSQTTVEGALRHYEVFELHADSTAAVDSVALRDFLDPKPAEQPRSTHRPVLSGEGAVQRITTWVGTLIEGERNRGLFWAACRLAEQGLTPTDAFEALRQPAEAIGLSQREVALTVRSAYRTACSSPVRSSPEVNPFSRREPQRASPVRSLA